MKKNQVNAILVDQTKRRKKIFMISSVIFILVLISLSFLFVYFIKNKNYSVNYKENSSVDYKVYLKENEFFEQEYLGPDSEYIASLISFIDANFKYKISMDEVDVDYKYSYRIEATVDVKEAGNSKPLYTNTKEIMRLTDLEATGEEPVEINEYVPIDYNEYNDLIKNFVAIYGLDDIVSTLTINMFVEVIGSCDMFEEDSSKESVVTLSIPLTTKTMGIDIKNNLVESNDNVIICSDANMFTVVYLIISILIDVIIAIIVYGLIKYIITTRTAETIYDIELKKILNNYHSYIQKVSNKMDLKTKDGLLIDSKFMYKGCQFFKLETFTDLLEIRDSVNAPILMSNNESNTSTYFVILDVVNKAVYVYGLRVNDIKKQMKNNAIEKGYVEIIEKNESKTL